MIVFATKTNLSAEEFEDSFDKGFYVSIPANFSILIIQLDIFHLITSSYKDGGTLLTQHNALYSILGDISSNSILEIGKI